MIRRSTSTAAVELNYVNIFFLYFLDLLIHSNFLIYFLKRPRKAKTNTVQGETESLLTQTSRSAMFSTPVKMANTEKPNALTDYTSMKTQETALGLMRLDAKVVWRK